MGMQPYQNYVMNAYFWFLVGILFRLPHLARAHEQKAVPSQAAAPVMQGIPAFARSR
jgi:hypothetical protein